MSEARTYVPDGDPCPKAGHGEPTKLIHVPGLGLVSQCPKCIDDFLAWYGGQTRGTPALAIPDLRSPARPVQLELVDP